MKTPSSSLQAYSHLLFQQDQEKYLATLFKYIHHNLLILSILSLWLR